MVKASETGGQFATKAKEEEEVQECWVGTTGEWYHELCKLSSKETWQPGKQDAYEPKSQGRRPKCTVDLTSNDGIKGPSWVSVCAGCLTENIQDKEQWRVNCHAARNELSPANIKGVVESSRSRQLSSCGCWLSKPLLQYKHHSGILWTQLFHSYLLFDHSDPRPSFGCRSVQIPCVLVLMSRRCLECLWSPRVWLCSISLLMDALCLLPWLLWSQPLLRGPHSNKMSPKKCV